MNLKEFFMLEFPNDDEGRPLRSQDPFSAPPLHKAVPNTASRAGITQKQQQITPPAKDAPKRANPVKPLVKPSYRGSYIGQTQTTNSQMNYKNVAWQDKQSGEQRYGRVPSMQKQTLVWDGNDWVPQADFDYRAKQGKIKK